ncbi:MAG: hypothetical protein JSU66_17285 [Deltaproteobacteria bacterium]|nr:MAG: hypothetical protein JSU66_17285 [Deltaproteobacteria bacterium]
MNGFAVAEGTSPARVTLAWGVHLLTASGALFGALALLAIASDDLPRAALFMLVALAIDSIDGSLARAARVREVLPGFDGRRLDDIVDYLNYVIVPAVFLVGAGSLLASGFAAFPILASAYGFSQTDAKTDDDFFLGFPSYWNVVALYLWLLAVDARVGTTLVVVLSAAVFVPLKYLYPSKMPVLRRTTNAVAALWLLLLAGAVLQPARLGTAAVWASLAFPAYYLALSFWLGNRAGRTP